MGKGIRRSTYVFHLHKMRQDDCEVIKLINDLIKEFSAEDISFAKTHPRYKAGELGKIDDRLD